MNEIHVQSDEYLRACAELDRTRRVYRAAHVAVNQAITVWGFPSRADAAYLEDSLLRLRAAQKAVDAL